MHRHPTFETFTVHPKRTQPPLNLTDAIKRAGDPDPTPAGPPCRDQHDRPVYVSAAQRAAWPENGPESPLSQPQTPLTHSGRLDAARKAYMEAQLKTAGPYFPGRDDPEDDSPDPDDAPASRLLRDLPFIGGIAGSLFLAGVVFGLGFFLVTTFANLALAFVMGIPITA